MGTLRARPSDHVPTGFSFFIRLVCCSFGSWRDLWEVVPCGEEGQGKGSFVYPGKLGRDEPVPLWQQFPAQLEPTWPCWWHWGQAGKAFLGSSGAVFLGCAALAPDTSCLPDVLVIYGLSVSELRLIQGIGACWSQQKGREWRKNQPGGPCSTIQLLGEFQSPVIPEQFLG